MLGNTMNFIIDSPINAMAVSREGTQLAVAGRSLLKVYSLSNDKSFGNELFNLRSSNLKNLNFSNNDVTWCPNDDGILATAATNGGVVVWNLQNSAKSKISHVFNDHKRTVNKVCFHHSEPNYLLSGSQDGCMKLFDLRRREASSTFVSNSESVRDVQFSPSAYSNYHFASVQETGNVEIWDIRRTDKPETHFVAHDGPVFACEWHPNQESYKWLATGGRDKVIKIWDMSNRSKPQTVYNVHTIATVSKLKWRPTKDFHIGSCSLVVDFSVYVWDIKRPFVPYAIFSTRKDVTTGFAWKNDPFVFISTCKDGTVYQHRFETDAYYPAEHYPPIGIDINPAGNVVFAMTDFIYRYSQDLNNAQNKQVVPAKPNSVDSLSAASSKLIKTNSLGTNSIITTTGIMSGMHVGSPTATAGTHMMANQPYSLSSSLTQNVNDNALSTSMTDVKNRLVSMGFNAANQYFSNPFQQQQQQQLQSHHQNHSLQYYQNSISQSVSNYPPYNISIPISYKKTAEPILSEHFRCMVSYMMLFLSKDIKDSTHGVLQNYISMKYFTTLAKHYLVCERPFEELCEHNAVVADSLKRHQIAQTWRIVRHMFSVGGRHPTSSGGGAGNNPSGGSLPNMPSLSESLGISMSGGGDFKMKSDNPSRHTSGGTRHFSGNNPANSSANANINQKDSSDEDELIEAFDPNHNLFTPIIQGDTIPSNKFNLDFFNYQSIIDNDYDGNTRTKFQNCEENYNYFDQDWELQRESIFHRHNITEFSMPLNELSTNNATDPIGGNTYDANSPVSFDEDDDIGPSESGLFDINVKSLLSVKNPVPQSWPFTGIVADMLRHYADIGDIQTTISIILVLGDKMKQVQSIDKQTISIWFRSYIDLLHQFQLFNVSCRLMQLSADPEIQAINQTSTSVLVYCAKCHKSIRTGSVCDKCRMEPSNCAICNVSVRGLYVWCQGCSHGGHLQHMLEWFKNNALCPAGCGHQCELC